ncbi:efflux RND transporter periplasmic adaptor subunit [Leptospira wolffii]|uniref:efflux RND transporter periplasmic adaptor subunit n=1 Tax=Leptospira wolffii TaxID=409998 RepID=UPI0039EF7F6F
MLRGLIRSSFILAVLFFIVECGHKKEIYYCPMHPHYTSDKPGTCPICNMDLVKKEDSNSDHSDHEKKSTLSEAKQMEEGELLLSNEKQQSIGIKTEEVALRDLAKKFRAYSNVAYDPELYAALTEYKEALRSSAVLSDSAGIGLGNLQLRLRQLGLSPDQIRLWASGKRDPSELILGGKGGRAHIYSQIYESDLTSVKPGLEVRFKTDVYPEKEFPGKIQSIDTILDKNNRTLRLRSEVSDPQHLLKPQMFGEVEIDWKLKRILSVPTSAILDTGRRKIVYMQTGPDRFRAVEVETGKSTDTWTEILSGLEQGQRVVSESTFLLDSEAKIRFGSGSEPHVH